MAINLRGDTEWIADEISVAHLVDALRRWPQRFAGLNQKRRALFPSIADLPADLKTINSAGERLPQDFGEPRHRRQHLHRVAMDEHEARVEIHSAQSIERENMIGALQHPLARAVLMLQVLQEALVKAICLQMPCLIQPALIRRNVMRGVEAQAPEHVAGNLDTLLRRPRIERMKTRQLRRQHQEGGILASRHVHPRIAS